MSDIRTVTVRFDPENLVLEVQEPEVEVEVEEGQILEWVFEGVPVSLSPMIAFEEAMEEKKPLAKGKHYFGPFDEITQVLSVVEGYRMYVWGEVRSDHGEEFAYRALAQKGISEDACDEEWPGKPDSVAKALFVSEICRLRVKPATQPRERAERALEHEAARERARVIPVTEKLRREDRLSIREEDKQMQIGADDVVFWDFTATRRHKDYVPQLDFVGVEDPQGEVKNVHFGHFTSLSYTSGGVLARGSTGVGGKYHYRVSMFSYSENRFSAKASPDPTTDGPGEAGKP